MVKSFFSNKVFLFYFLTLTFFNFYLIGNQSVREILKTIPEDEKEALEDLFQELFNQDNFSYTLFGDKPMSLSSHFISSFDNEGIPSDIKLAFWNRWAIWKKYEKAFPMTHYLLIEGLEDRKTKDIYFIHKEHFIIKFNEYLDLFRKELGENITGKILLERIEENHKFLSLLNNYQTLLGILLGYGEHNARLFDEGHQISHFVYKREFPKIPIKIPSPSKGFSSLKEEFNSYFQVLTHFGDTKYSPLTIHSVHFVADHTHPETISLQQKYKKMRDEISAIYAKGNFLEITLSKLMED